MAEVVAEADHIEEVVALVACHCNFKHNIATATMAVAAEAAASVDLASSCFEDIQVVALTLVQFRVKQYYLLELANH